MGVFNYTPRMGDKAQVTLYYKDKSYDYSLSPPLAEGYVLNVDNSQTDSLYVTVNKSDGIEPELLGLSFISGGNICFFHTLLLRDNCYRLAVDKSIFPLGIGQFNLFDSKGEIYAERMVFNHFPDLPQTEVSHMPDTLKPFGLTTLNIQMKNSRNEPLQSAFSLAVRDAGSEIKTYYADNAGTYLLLSSDLKGYVENPGYYFECDDKVRRNDLDLLVLVQGWRRYAWRDMANLENLKLKHYAEEQLQVDGRVLSFMRRKPFKDINVSMWTYNDTRDKVQRSNCMTDENGDFNFPVYDFTGRQQMSISIKQDKKKGKNAHILLNRVFAPALREYDFFDTHIVRGVVSKDDWLTPIKPKSVSELQELPEVFVKAQTLGGSVLYTFYDVEKDREDMLDQGKHVFQVSDYLIEKGCPLSYDYAINPERGIGGYSSEELNNIFANPNMEIWGWVCFF